MRYWIVSELFYPEEVSTGYVMTKIAEKLNETESVGVICGPSDYQAGVFKAKYELSNKILIKRVNTPRFNKNNLLLRILGFFLLTTAIAFKIITNVKRGDKLILVTNPPTLLPVTAFLKILKGFGFIIIVHDVFPENAVAGEMIKKKSLLYKFLLLIFNRSYNVTDHLIVVGGDMEELFRKKVGNKKPISIITNWADHDEIFPITSSAFRENYKADAKNKIVIQFAGNIGRVQGLDQLFRILGKIMNHSWYLILVGDGAQKSLLERIVEENHIKNIQFLASRPRVEQNDFLNACDIGLVTLCSGMFGLGVPSKVYNIFSAGKPVLFIGDRDAEISRYINQYNTGWAFSWDNTTDIIDFFENIDQIRPEIILKGDNARILTESRFTKNSILSQYYSVIING
ncbi:MAG: glycosyltransferase family 4 protein [Sediminibacterium sp.]|nr:glycosyltransferase family 4 protein [Sediminibacterium sp.]